MSICGYRRLTIALAVVSFSLLIGCACLFCSLAWLTVHVAFASEQTAIFEAMRTRALQSDAAGAAGCLEYVVRYYPSGSKQEPGSQLDRMVERERARAARDIVIHLRTRTGEELGENPEAWIRKYATR